MNNQVVLLTIGVCLVVFMACDDNSGDPTPADNGSPARKGTYAYDAAFLHKHTNRVIELTGNNGQARVLLSADFQGRVMTSSAMGDSGISYGWLNYDLIEAGANKKQFNPVGGEERFWMGPEGGQYSIYFNPGDSFTISNWQVPAIIDTIAYDVAQADTTTAVFTKNATLTNYSGTQFDIAIKRSVTLLNKTILEQKLGVSIPATVHTVGFETNNAITNTGTTGWKKESGLLSTWLLCMMTPTDQTTVMIPFKGSADAKKYISDDYFGAIPPERLTIQDSILFFTCDGKKRSKIGLSPVIAKPIAGSYDFGRNVLTVIVFPVDRDGLYVNSKWEIQKEPYKGDVVNSYNDGPLEDGTQLGPFYELESSSAARPLQPGETQQYAQVTCHFQGDFNSLQQLAMQLLGVDLNTIKK